jgi:hypothetical protein
MSTPKLASYVHVQDDSGKTYVFGPTDRVPDWAVSKITNPRAWEGGKVPTPEDPAARVKRLRAELAAAESQVSGEGSTSETPSESDDDGPPPKSGAGSGVAKWREYAARHGVEVPADASREDVITALTEADVPTE